jgi:hypothetical protein
MQIVIGWQILHSRPDQKITGQKMNSSGMWSSQQCSVSNVQYLSLSRTQNGRLQVRDFEAWLRIRIRIWIRIQWFCGSRFGIQIPETRWRGQENEEKMHCYLFKLTRKGTHSYDIVQTSSIFLLHSILKTCPLKFWSGSALEQDSATLWIRIRI